MRRLVLAAAPLALGACSPAPPAERPPARATQPAPSASTPAAPASSTAAPLTRLASPQLEIPAGEAGLGCQPPFRLCERGRVEARRSVARFFLDAQPVTRQAYGACVTAGVCAPLGAVSGPEGDSQSPRCAEPLSSRANERVTCVSAAEAAQYCGWLQRRLPDEAEWQRAADLAASAPQRGLAGLGAGLEHVRGRLALSDTDSALLALLFPEPERWSVVRGSLPGEDASLRLPFEGRSEGVGFRCARSPGVPEVPTQPAEPAVITPLDTSTLSAGALALSHYVGRCRVAEHWLLPGGQLRAACAPRAEPDGRRRLDVTYLGVDDGRLVAGLSVGPSGPFDLLAPLLTAAPLSLFALEVDEAAARTEQPSPPQRARGEGLLVTFREPVLRVTTTRGAVVLQRAYPEWDRTDWSSEDADCRNDSNLTWMLEGVTGSRGAGLLLVSLGGWGTGLCAHAEHSVRLPP